MDHEPRLDTTRRMLGAIFLFGSFGTGAELMLMGTPRAYGKTSRSSSSQSGAAARTGGAQAGLTQLRAFQLVLILFVVSGVAGVLLHYKGNTEFELELNPDLSGVALFSESMRAQLRRWPPAR